MSWNKVKEFIGDAAPIVGTLIGGPGGGAVGGLVASWLGVEEDPAKVLEKLQTDPGALLKIKQMEHDERQQLRQLQYQQTLDKMKDNQHQHEQQQETIRSGDNAEDEVVRRTRPNMAKKSQWAGIFYVIIMEVLKAFGHGDGADFAMAGTLFAPCLAYMGFRTWDKFSPHTGPKMGGGALDKVTTTFRAVL